MLAARECEYLLAARKLLSSAVTRGLIQYEISSRKAGTDACLHAYPDML